MFSAFQYYETKQLSLAGLFYIVTMALLCSLYLILDRPDYHFDKPTTYAAPTNYWVSYELSGQLQAKDIYHGLSYVLSNLDMNQVSFRLECNEKICTVSFIPLTQAGKNAANSALGQMRNLKL